MLLKQCHPDVGRQCQQWFLANLSTVSQSEKRDANATQHRQTCAAMSPSRQQSLRATNPAQHRQTYAVLDPEKSASTYGM